MLFKYTYNKGANETNQLDSLKRYCDAFHIETSFFGMMETIEDVEARYIVPVIGEAQYTDLDDAYQAGTMTAAQTALVRKLQPAIAYFAYFQAITTKRIQISNIGPGETVSKEGTFVFPRQWSAKDALRKSWSVANERLDRALSFLHYNIANYPIYAADPVYAESLGLFFNSADELTKYLPSDTGRVVYQQLRPGIREAELRYIRPTMGDAFFAEIKAAIAAKHTTPLSAAQAELVEKVQEALIHWTRICAIPNLRLRISQSGLVETDYDQTVDYQQAGPSGEDAVRSLWISLQQAGSEFLSGLKSWLDLNAASFPTYLASQQYTEPGTENPFLDEFNYTSGGVGSLL
jgi:hypothetical protein